MQIYLAPTGLEDVLEEELSGRILERRGRLYVTGDAPSAKARWAQNQWLDAETLSFSSISEAAKHLRSIQRNWCLHAVACHRRAQLIQAQLPVLKVKPLVFPTALPKAPLGSWTLFDEKTMIYSPRCRSPFPDGEVHFQENKVDPPSRAYLKLWEFFTVAGMWPTAGDRVVDLGSSPGGWTWALDQLGAQVLSVDKAPLASGLKLSRRVEFRAESAFAIDSKSVGRVDWLFSDIVCYPERLQQLILAWKDVAKNLVCTIKFQGPTNHRLVDELLAIPGSQVRHLFHNKHELTWARL